MIRFFRFRTHLVVLGLLAVGCGYRLLAQQRDPGLTPPPRPTAVNSNTTGVIKGLPFRVGELLSFNVSWASYGTAARLEMEVVDQGGFFGQEGLQLRSRVETVAEVRSLFVQLDNQYTSYVQIPSLLPHRLENSIRRGSRQINETVIIDQRSRNARFDDDSSVSLQSESFDLTSLVYALRMRNPAVGAKEKFSALYGKEVWELDLEARERERIQTQTGSYDAVRLELSAKGRSKYRVRLWLSTDEQRLPVLISARLPFGDVRAELSSISHRARPKPILSKEKFSEGPKGSEELYAKLEQGRPFAVGERLNYDVSWASFVTVGQASFAVRQRGWIGEQKVIELVGEATTTGAARSLIDVNDQLTSLVDVRTLVPVRTETRLREGSRSKQVTANYNSADGSVRLTNGTQLKVAAGTLDFISLFYSVRASDLKPGTTSSYNLLSANHRPVTLIFKVIKQESVTVPFGTLPALHLDVLDRDGKQVIAQVWISNDTRRLPLYLAVRTRFGELRFQLTSAIGTR